jgi:hypothetical protein
MLWVGKQRASQPGIGSQTGERRRKMKKQNLALALFWIGLVIAVAFAAIGTWSLMHNLRTLTADELDATIWASGGPLFILWALSVTLGSLVAGIGEQSQHNHDFLHSATGDACNT